jgi:hypothetical protein
MANTGTDFNSASSSNLPRPIISLSNNYILQHFRVGDFNTFINNTYSSSNRNVGGSVSQDGNAWANDNLKVGISFAEGEWETFLSNTPMVFMEVLNHKNSKNGKFNKPQWSHPVHRTGPLNRTTSNYGGGDAYGLLTEWDITNTKPFVENYIEINQKFLYKNTSINLPQRWVDFIVDPGNQLKYQRSYYTTPTDLLGNRAINTFKQPIRFRFAYINPNDGRSIVLGEPSDELLISPKWGHFIPEDDTYIYDWQIRFHK